MPVASGLKWWMSRHHKKTEVTWKEVNKLRILACNKTLQSLAAVNTWLALGTTFRRVQSGILEMQ